MVTRLEIGIRPGFVDSLGESVAKSRCCARSWRLNRTQARRSAFLLSCAVSAIRLVAGIGMVT